MSETSITRLTPAAPAYPASLRAALGQDAPATLTAIGDVTLLQRPALALVCSVRCPGERRRLVARCARCGC